MVATVPVKSKKIALACTSATHFGKSLELPSGVWLEEASTPYYAFKEAGFEVVFTSPAGGPIPIDQGSVSGDFFVESAKKFLHDADALGAFSHSVKLESIKEELVKGDAGEYCCLYVAGGHGSCTDMVDNAVVKACIEGQYSAGLAALDCHGPIALAQCTKKNAEGAEEPLIKGLKVAGFSDAEEGMVQQVDNVPFLIEQKFVELGGMYEKGDPWTAKAVRDGNLITGQNPQSSAACAELVLAALAEKGF